MIRPLIAAAVLASCAAEPIEWSDPVPGTGLADVSLAPGSRPRYSGMCEASLRIARDGASGWYAAWWTVRSDSTADLSLSHSPDGRRWTNPVRADTLDAGRTGCRRPPPSIVANNGNVHVAYGMTAREGPGIFTVHSMDQARMVHAPVAVVYGERYGNTSIAARGDTVVVAYEDPNSTPRRIGLALSRTAAHLFQWRGLVSAPTGEARDPLVALGNREVVVSWNQSVRGATSSELTRTGTIK